MTEALSWLSLALLGVAIAAAVGALSARSLFSACMHLVCCGVSVAAVALLLRPGEGSLALALIAAGWAPLLLMAAMLLSDRKTKSERKRAPWLSVLSAVAACAAIWAPSLELSATAPTATVAVSETGLGLWLAPLVLVIGAAVVGMLGYGERGVLTRGPRA